MTDGGKNNLQRFIRFSTVVRKVEYHQDKQKFTVTVHNLPKDHIYDDSEFSHVIVAVGIFSVPHIPSISGIESFRGRICHSRDFRDLGEFKGKKILLLGSSYSAQDLAQATLKYGADRVICSWKTGPMGYKWSAGIEERPLVRNIVGNSVYFIDDTSAEVDVVIFCTGYRKYYPFLPDDLRLKGELSFYPDHLYKGILWMNGGNERLLYLGSQNQAFTLAMFDVQAFWACKYITGLLTVPDQKSMLQNIEYWKKKYEPVKDALGAINFQTDYVIDLANKTGYKNKFKEHNVIYHLWFRHRNEDIGTFRDRQFTSVYSGILATPPKKPWLESFFWFLFCDMLFAMYRVASMTSTHERFCLRLEKETNRSVKTSKETSPLSETF